MVKRAVFPKKKKVKSLIEEFIYPRLGYGVIWEKMKDEVLSKKGSVLLESEVTKVNHDGNKIISIEVKDKNGTHTLTGEQFISTIPLTELVKKLSPAPSQEVLEACNKLKFRDWIGITYVMNKKRITADTWLYVPDPSLKFGRIQQWANWSEGLIKGDNGSLMLEYFVFEGDEIWNKTDDELLEFGKKELCEKLKFMNKEDIIDGFVLRARKTYPVYAMGYEHPLELVKNHVKTFSNLQIIGRYGTFRYNNADHSIEMGIQAAEKILGRPADPDAVNKAKEYHEEIEEDVVD
jgi:protoporphyrinogen oxidase